MQKGFQTVNLQGSASGVLATPVIGENGNWWIGNEDTGIHAQGEKGETGETGPKGDQGSSGPQGPKGDTPELAVNLTTREPGKALDATMGKELKDNADTLSDELSVVSKDLGGLKFGYTADGLPGYKKEGADTVYPFQSNIEINQIGSGYNYSASIDAGDLLNVNVRHYAKLVIGSANFSQSNNMGISVIGRKNSTDTQIAVFKNTTAVPSTYALDYDSLIFQLVKGTGSSETCTLNDIIISV